MYLSHHCSCLSRMAKLSLQYSLRSLPLERKRLICGCCNTVLLWTPGEHGRDRCAQPAARAACSSRRQGHIKTKGALCTPVHLMPYMASAVEFTLYVPMLGKGLLHCTPCTCTPIGNRTCVTMPFKQTCTQLSIHRNKNSGRRTTSW